MRLFASCARKMASQSARASRNGQQTLKSPTRVASKVAKRAADPEVVGWFMDRKSPVSAGLFIFALSMKKHLLHCPP
jgi:hypothetical protein